MYTHKASNIYLKILQRLRMVLWKVHDHILSGLNINHGSITLLKRSFDSDYYIEHNPDVLSAFKDTLKHFLIYGIYEHRKARFFDALWYSRQHPDVTLTPIDAFSHYRLYGKDEGRSARYFEIKSVLERTHFLVYEDWHTTYDSVGEATREALVHRVSPSSVRKKVTLALHINDDFSTSDVKAFFQSLDQQVTNLFDLVVLTDSDNTRWDDLIASSGGTKAVYGNEPSNTPLSVLASLTETVKTEYIWSINTPVRLNPLVGFWLNAALEQTPSFDLCYFDDDEIDEQGKRSQPRFKSQSNPELMLVSAFIGPFVIFKCDTLKTLGGFNTKLGDHADIGLALRIMSTPDSVVKHVPYVGVHKTKPWTINRTVYKKILEDHLKRQGITANISAAPESPNGLRIQYPVPAHIPLVSIIIPTRDRLDLLRMCVTSVIERTTYLNYEIIIVDNGSVEPQTLKYLAEIASDTIHVLRDDRPFNYSALNNAAAKVAKGEYLCLMNNDIEVITPDWIEEMLGFAARADTGCVGARLWYPDRTLQHGGVLIGFHNAAGHLHKHLPKGETGYMDRAVLQQNVGAVTAACLMVAKDTYWQVDGLDEDFVVAFNDVDFCLKVEALGLRNVWTPYAEMIHYESASRGANITPEKLARENREVNLLRTKWGDRLKHEPTYSPNLTFTAEDLSLAFPPRTETIIDYLGKTTAKSNDRISGPKR